MSAQTWQYADKATLKRTPLPEVGAPMPNCDGIVTEVKQLAELEFVIYYDSTL